MWSEIRVEASATTCVENEQLDHKTLVVTLASTYFRTTADFFGRLSESDETLINRSQRNILCFI